MLIHKISLYMRQMRPDYSGGALTLASSDRWSDSGSAHDVVPRKRKPLRFIATLAQRGKTARCVCAWGTHTNAQHRGDRGGSGLERKNCARACEICARTPFDPLSSPLAVASPSPPPTATPRSGQRCTAPTTAPCPPPSATTTSRLISPAQAPRAPCARASGRPR